jgi:cyclic beta-1,2-glucan synthetase
MDGALKRYPRVFGLAWAFVAHSDSRFDPEMLGRFVRAYQCIQRLTIGELWAVAITLRVVLVENLRRLAEDIANCQAARQEADALADLLQGLSGQAAEPVDTVLRRFERQSEQACRAGEMDLRIGAHYVVSGSPNIANL